MQIELADLSVLAEVHNNVPEMHSGASVEAYQQRLADNPYLAIVARHEQQAVGFKLGYALDKSCFYSWVGGVLPQYRGKGIANALLMYQENWALEQGYQQIRVKSMNCYPNMLKMLLSNGYRICDFEPRQNLDTAKIHLCKQL